MGGNEVFNGFRFGRQTELGEQATEGVVVGMHDELLSDRRTLPPVAATFRQEACIRLPACAGTMGGGT